MKEKILDMVSEYCDEYLKEKPFNPETDRVSVGYPCYSDEELRGAISTLLDLRLSQGPKVKEFERLYSEYIGTRFGVACNSGSSANLLALSVLLKSGKVKAGSEVILPATTFATVVMPIVQLGLVPRFVDVDRDTYNINLVEMEMAINNNTGLIMPVPTLACPIDMRSVMDVANYHNLPVLEDCCEAHGASWDGKKMGSFGTLSTFSFFVAHNITTGEGGMVMTNDEELYSLLQSMREFGRLKEYDKNKSRFYYSNDELQDFDERYAFEVVGYNLRMTDIYASLGIPQVRKLDELNKQRNEIADYYTKHLSDYEFHLQLPFIPDKGEHAFYGYIITVKPDNGLDRKTIVNYLEDNGIDTRAIMGGNLAKQPCMKNEKFEVHGDLKNANYITDNSFFIGCHPHINQGAREHVVNVFKKFFSEWELAGI
jgi:CDP-6-deoxy-D-xylo-4-hexulose-3-dehydrase